MSDLYLRNLPIPFFSQRENEYIYKERYTKNESKDLIGNESLFGSEKPNGTEYSMGCNTCNLTCVCMALHYYGFKEHTPTSLITKFFNDHLDYNQESVEDWNLFNQFILDNYHDKGIKTELFGESVLTIKKIKEKIALGYPVLISVAIEIEKNHGHVVIVRGFTKIGDVEYVILNDPWGSQVKLDNFLASGATCYGGYYQNNGDYGNGDNVLIKASEFSKLIQVDKSKTYSDELKLYRGLSVEGILWNYPDGSEIKEGNNINSHEILTGGVFPISANNLWHDGIHLNISELHSIGPGRLIAARIDENACGAGDNSFLLLKHNFVNDNSANNEPKEFFTLYMHIKPFSVKNVINTYFTTGKFPEEDSYNWLNQIIKNLLPFKYIIAKGPSKNEGKIIAPFTNIKIYNASYSDGVFYKGDELTSDELNNYRLGQRMMITPLPANNLSLFNQLLDPTNYNNSTILKELGLSANYIKSINQEKYLFYYSLNKLYCVKYDESYYSGEQLLQKFVNENQFRANAERLYNLSQGNVTVFSDYKRKDSSADVVEEEYKQKELSNYFNSVKDNSNWIVTTSIDNNDDLTYYLSLLNNLYIQSFGNISETFKTKLETKFDECAKKYSDGRKDELVKFLQVLEKSQDLTVEEKESSKGVGDLYYEKALELLKIKDLNLTINKGKNCIETGQSFLRKIESWDYLNKKNVIEYFLIYLLSIKAEEIKGKDYFTVGDKSIKILLDAYIQVFIEDICNRYFKNELYLKQIDTFIEIGKNETLGQSGKYRVGNNLQSMIHFEIFSEEDLLNAATGKEITDTDSDSYFNPVHCINQIKDVLTQNSEYTEKLQYFEDNILLEEEIENFYKDIPLIKEYSYRHISEWAKGINFKQHIENETEYSQHEFVYTSFENNIKEKINNTDYEKVFHEPFAWFEKSVFAQDKSKFNDSLAWYYHPLYFIEKLLNK